MCTQCVCGGCKLADITIWWGPSLTPIRTHLINSPLLSFPPFSTAWRDMVENRWYVERGGNWWRFCAQNKWYSIIIIWTWRGGYYLLHMPCSPLSASLKYAQNLSSKAEDQEGSHCPLGFLGHTQCHVWVLTRCQQLTHSLTPNRATLTCTLKTQHTELSARNQNKNTTKYLE